MIEFGDLFNAKSNPVKNPVYKPLEKELKSLFNEFSKENANNFRKHIDSDKQVDYDERIHQYYSALPDSSDLKDELVSFFKNEGIIKKFELDPSEQENANAEEIFNHNASLSSPPDVLSMSYIYLMTPIAPLYTLDNFIQELCFLNNPDCPVFLQQTNAFWDDIFNALIFNLNYKRRKSLKIKYDSISMQALYALYNDSVGEPISVGTIRTLSSPMMPHINLQTNLSLNQDPSILFLPPCMKIHQKIVHSEMYLMPLVAQKILLLKLKISGTLRRFWALIQSRQFTHSLPNLPFLRQKPLKLQFLFSRF